jgi:hypothetical protein
MTFGPDFYTQEQDQVPLSRSANYMVGTAVVLMFLLGIFLIYHRLRNRGRTIRRTRRRTHRTVGRATTLPFPSAPPAVLDEGPIQPSSSAEFETANETPDAPEEALRRGA